MPLYTSWVLQLMRVEMRRTEGSGAMHCLIRLAIRSWSVRPAGCARSGIMPPGTACIMASLLPNRASATHAQPSPLQRPRTQVQLGLKSGILGTPRAPSDNRSSSPCSLHSVQPWRNISCQKPGKDLSFCGSAGKHYA